MPSIAQLERLLASDPRDHFTLYALAQEHARLGQLDRAIEFFDRALEVNPDDGYTYYHKAKTLDAANRRAEAVATLRTGVAAAQRSRDSKALSELHALLDEFE